MRKLEIYLADLYHINKYTQVRLCVPLNIGYISSYLLSLYNQEVNISLFKDPLSLIEAVSIKKPDIVGFSFYNWNTNLNGYLSEYIKNFCKGDVVTVFGGPSIDSDEYEKSRLPSRFPFVDYFIEGEGEYGFCQLVGRIIDSKQKLFETAVDGVFFFEDGIMVEGDNKAFKMNLIDIPSPYLGGVLDEFLRNDYMPLLQFTRMCPYTCKFCVSGKDKGKLRSFPMDVIKEEIDYVAQWNKDKPHVLLNLAELNFGIIKQDSEIAEYIRMVSDKTGYPKSIYFYSDKKFTENAREVIRALGSLNRDGLIFSLQSDTPEALSAVKRKNISDKDIEDGILFAANENIPVATEMIFGLPYDTKESMIRLLNKVVLQGFDSVLLHNLFLTDGVELNRKYFRDKYGFKTKYRLLGSNYSEINSTVIAEVEEVLVESEFFDFGDYLSIRSLNVMFFAVYQGGFYKYFFRYISELGIPVASFFDMFMNPNWSGENNYHVRFVNKFKDRASSELHNNNKDVYIVAKNLFDINNDVGDPVRLNPLYYSLLMYDEESWVSESFRRCLIELKVDITDRELKLADNLLSVCSNMIVDLMDVDACQQESFVEYNLVAWEKEKFLKSIYKYKLSEKSRVAYYLEDVQRNKILSFCSNNRLNKKDFLYTAVETIFPRSDLFYKIKVVL